MFLEEVVAGRKQVELVMPHKKVPCADWEPFLGRNLRRELLREYGANRHIFSRGDPADSVFYLRQGKVKLTVTSEQGRKSIVAILGDGEFFGEGCLAGQPLRARHGYRYGRLHSAKN